MKKILIFSSFLLLLGVTTGCFSSKAESPPDWSEYGYDERMEAKNLGGEGIDILIDNSQSMYGFVASASVHNKKSSFVVAFDTLLELGESRGDLKTYKLNPDENGILNLGTVEDPYQYRNKNFYTYAGFFANGKGPLQLLSESSVLSENNSRVKVILTDLCEQNLRQSRLGNNLREISKKNKEGICIFGIQSNFDGVTSVPVPGTLDNAENLVFNDVEFHGQCPFYMILMGPDPAIIKTSVGLKEGMIAQGLIEGGDFNQELLLYSGGLKNYTENDILRTEIASGFEGRTPENTNETANLKEILVSDFFKDVTDSRLGICYEYWTKKQDPSHRDKAVLNFIVPIQSIDPSIDVSKNQYFVKNPRLMEYIKNSWKINENFDNDIKINVEKYSDNKILKTKGENTDGEMIREIPENKDGFVKVSLEFEKDWLENKKSMAIPVDFVNESMTTIPGWVSEWTLKPGEKNYSKTYGLDGFYKALIGLGQDSETVERNMLVIKINLKK